MLLKNGSQNLMILSPFKALSVNTAYLNETIEDFLESRKLTQYCLYSRSPCFETCEIVSQELKLFKQKPITKEVKQIFYFKRCYERYFVRGIRFWCVLSTVFNWSAYVLVLIKINLIHHTENFSKWSSQILISFESFSITYIFLYNWVVVRN